MSKNKKNQEIYEQRCFTFLKEYFGSKFINFHQEDYPDYQNKIDNIGVEITDLKNEEIGREMGFVEKMAFCSSIEEINQLSDKIFNSKYKDNVSVDENSISSYCSVKDFDLDLLKKLIRYILKKKLDKLNSDKFIKFNTNILLIMNSDLHTFIELDDIKNIIIDEIKNIEMNHKIKFDKYIIVKPKTPKSELFVINENKDIEHYKFDYPYEIETLKFEDEDNEKK